MISESRIYRGLLHAFPSGVFSRRGSKVERREVNSSKLSCYTWKDQRGISKFVNRAATQQRLFQKPNLCYWSPRFLLSPMETSGRGKVPSCRVSRYGGLLWLEGIEAVDWRPDTLAEEKKDRQTRNKGNRKKSVKKMYYWKKCCCTLVRTKLQSVNAARKAVPNFIVDCNWRAQHSINFKHF